MMKPWKRACLRWLKIRWLGLDSLDMDVTMADNNGIEVLTEVLCRLCQVT